MHVGLYAAFTPGMPGGTEVYIRELTAALAQIADDREDRFSLFLSESSYHAFDSLAPHFSKVLYRQQPIPIKVIRRILHGLKLPTSSLSFPYKRHGVDLMHFLSSTLDRWANVPCVLTLHDLQHEFFPEFFYKEELQARRMYFPLSVRKAVMVICDSQFTKDAVMDRYGLSEDKIRVIHLGVGDQFRRSISEELVYRVKVKYDLGDEHVLFYPARTWPHKNHIRLFEALAVLRDRYNCPAKLVLTGGEERAHQDVDAAIDRFGLKDSVRQLGLVSYDELPALYSLADALVFPSLFEGFGLPVVEAMYIGCPVICSNTASLPEVAGKAALYFDPIDIDGIANAMYRVLHEPTLQQELISRGREQAKRFSWERAARSTVEVYKEALASVR